MTVAIKGGEHYLPKDADEVRCDVHGVVTTWGALSPIAQLVVEEGLDVSPDMRCLLLSDR